jgi:hypothetical protein
LDSKFVAIGGAKQKIWRVEGFLDFFFETRAYLENFGPQVDI